MLRSSRVAILENAGYWVTAAVTDYEAITVLEDNQFDLVLIGRNSESRQDALDQRLREKYPKLLVLKIQALDEGISAYPSRTIDAAPEHVVQALKDMLD